MNLSSKCVLVPAVVGVIALAGGCQAPASSSTAAATTPAAPAATTAIRSDVTDIHPLETAAAPAQTAAYQVAAAEAVPQPITYTSAPIASITPPVSAASSYSSRTPGALASAGSTHTVRRGETLYSIARESYGNGKAWQKIAMANPGVTPATLKVGQSLIIP